MQPYIRARPITRFDRLWTGRLVSLIGGDRRRASQMLCQAVAQWILENIDGNQNIIDGFGNCVLIDHDRSFFIDEHRVTTDWRAAWDARKQGRVIDRPRGANRSDGANPRSLGGFGGLCRSGRSDPCRRL